MRNSIVIHCKSQAKVKCVYHKLSYLMSSLFFSLFLAFLLLCMLDCQAFVTLSVFLWVCVWVESYLFCAFQKIIFNLPRHKSRAWILTSCLLFISSSSSSSSFFAYCSFILVHTISLAFLQLQLSNQSHFSSVLFFTTFC